MPVHTTDILTSRLVRIYTATECGPVILVRELKDWSLFQEYLICCLTSAVQIHYG